MENGYLNAHICPSAFGVSFLDLGDSWRMNPLSNDEDEGDEGENIDAIAGGGGVLGCMENGYLNAHICPSAFGVSFLELLN
jgi:hypothetical protein